MWRRVAVVLGTLLAGLTYLLYDVPPKHLFWLIPLIFLTVFYCLILKDYFSILAVVALLLFLTALGYSRTDEVTYFLMIPAFAVAIGAVLLHQEKWRTEIEEARRKRQTIEGESDGLEERYKVRTESLHHLELQVGGLVHLFEIARDFNECLDFPSLLFVIEQKIAPTLSFERGTIILIHPSASTEERIGGVLTFGRKKRQDESVDSGFVRECLKGLWQANRPVKIAAEDRSQSVRFEHFDTGFPLWLFPLSVEHQLIAIVAIEGSGPNEFQKFEILTSQLALQIKKIKLYETVKETAIVDGLTNVFVRRHFLERFQEEMKRAQRYHFPVTVLLVDVDHFKSYNDKFGHLVGDKTLREVALVIRENVRRVDVIGRYGGEEFIIVAPEIEKKQGAELAERIRSAVARKRFRLYDEETQVTVSIGVSSYPEDLSEQSAAGFCEADLQLLIEKSDRALYRAKEEGRNRVLAYGAP